MQKGFSLPLLLLVLALVCGAYYLGTKNSFDFASRFAEQDPVIFPSVSPQPNNKPTPDTKPITTDETANPDSIGANWKIYTNTKYGYSIKYPGDHTVYASADQKKPALIPATPTSDTVKIAAREDAVFLSEPSTLSFSIKATNKKPREWAEEYFKSVPEWEQELPIIKDTTFAGKRAVEANGRGGYGPPHRLIVISRNELLLVIIQDDNVPLLNEVISTVKFTN